MTDRSFTYVLLLVLLMPAAFAANVQLVIDNGDSRQEMTVVALVIAAGPVLRVVPDVIHAGGFDPLPRAPPDVALRSPPKSATAVAASSGTEARVKGTREHRNPDR